MTFEGTNLEENKSINHSDKEERDEMEGDYRTKNTTD